MTAAVRALLPGEGVAFTVEAHADRESWLAARRSAITGSDAAALWSAEIAERSSDGSAKVTPLGVYSRKVAGEEEIEQLNFAVGRAVEPAIRGWYERTTGRRVVYPGEFTILRSIEHPFLAVSLDGADVSDGPPAVWEAKHWAGGGHLWRDGVPLEIEAQVRHGMAVTGWPAAVVAGIIVGQWLVRRFDADPDFERLHMHRAADLWARIEAREEPDAEAGDGDMIERLHPSGSGAVQLGDRAMVHALALEVAKADRKLADTAADYHAARLKQMIGDAESAALPDGTVYTYKAQKRGAFSVEATEFRVLRRKGERA